MSVAVPAELRRRLLAWYDRQARELPWRASTDPWPVWVSEIMLQQTTVDTVIPYWRRFLKKFPTPGHLARAQETTAIKLWEGLGYYTRVRNLRKAAAQVHREGWPEDSAGWQQLPGIGPYTAAALASIVNNERIPVVDGNVFRVLSRLHADTTAIDGSKAREHFTELAAPLLRTRRPGDFNQALMELGALVCRPRQPDCGSCPWSGACQGRSEWQIYPRKNRRIKISSIDVAVGIIHDGQGRYLMDLRADHVVMGGLWEFPGGKIEKDETPEEGLHRELKEETGLRVSVVRALKPVQHSYTRFRVTLHPFLCAKRSGRLKIGDSAVARLEWMKPAQWRRLAMPAGSRKILKQHADEILRTLS